MLKQVSALIFVGCLFAALGCEAEAERGPAAFNPNAPPSTNKSTPFKFGGGVLGEEAQGPTSSGTSTACNNDADCPDGQVCNPASNLCEDDSEG